MYWVHSNRGTEEYLGLEPGRVDMINSTLGKALGGASGKLCPLFVTIKKTLASQTTLLV